MHTKNQWNQDSSEMSRCGDRDIYVPAINFFSFEEIFTRPKRPENNKKKRHEQTNNKTGKQNPDYGDFKREGLMKDCSPLQVFSRANVLILLYVWRILKRGFGFKFCLRKD